MPSLPIPGTLLVVKTASILFLASAIGLSSLSVTRSASALGPVDVEVAAKVGGGTNPLGDVTYLNPPAKQPNPLGFGLGARAGVSILGFYGGVSFMDYLGTSRVNQGVTDSLKSVLYGVEVGYNIGVPLLTFRPQLGIGNYTQSESLSGTPTGEPSAPTTHYSANSLYLEPGVTGLLSFGLWIVGADANLLYLPGVSNPQAALTAHGQVGMKF